MSIGLILTGIGAAGVLSSTLSLVRIQNRQRRRRVSLLVGLPGVILINIGLLFLHPHWWPRLLLLTGLLGLLVPLSGMTGKEEA